MIGTLARKRNNLVALTALLALVAALFVGLQSASAASSLVLKASNDSDGVVEAGATLTIQAQVKDPVEGKTYTLHAFQSDSNMVIASGTGVGSTEVSTTAATFTTVGTATVLSAAEDGTYNVSVVVRDGNVGATGTKYIPESYKITVGGSGDALGSVTVTLGKEKHSTTTGAADDTNQAPAYTEGVPDNATCTDGNAKYCIAVTVTVLNSIGNDANNADIASIQLYAPNAKVIIAAAGETADDNDKTVTSPTSNAAKFFVASSSPQTVNVDALVIGATGKGRVESALLPLHFSGPATKAVLGAVTGSLKNDDTQTAGVYFDVTATDSGGVTAALTAGQVEAVATKFPTGGAAANIQVTECDHAADNSGNAFCKDSGATAIPTDTIRYVIRDAADSGVQAKTGTYTIEVTLGTDKQTTEVVVVGDPSTVELSADMDTVAFGDVVTITATVKDKNGNLVANSTANSGSGDSAVGVGDGVVFVLAGGIQGTPLQDTEVEIVKGVAEARYVITKADSAAVVVANAASGKARGNLTLEATTAEADEPDPVDCSAVGTEGLSSTNGFSTWSHADCGTDAASLFAVLSARGASAIHLWNGSSWVRYSVVDGTEVPGSSNFSVKNNDILFISN